MDFILVSKKDVRRSGRRFIARGLDKEGNAVNFAETENAVIFHDAGSYKVASYI